MTIEAEAYRARVPQRVNERLVLNAILAVSAAHDEMGHWPDFERDIVPDLRRVNLLSGLMFATYGRGIAVNRVAHQGGSHVEIAGEGFLITSITRANMPTNVEPHQYRETLARIAQFNLFQPNTPPPSDHFLYGLLIFGGHFSRKLPTFCKMTFPTVDGELAPGTIDLLAECAHILEPFRDEEYRRRVTAEFIAVREMRRA